MPGMDTYDAIMLLFKNWKLYVLMLNANSCWLKVLFRVRLTATSWFVLA